MTGRAQPGRNAKGGKVEKHKAVDNRPGAAAQAPAMPGPWSVPVAVAEVPETGRHVELIPDEAMRQAIAREMGLVALLRLEASFDLERRGAEGLRVEGCVVATVVQSCVVTLEPIESEIDEAVNLVFLPPRAEPIETGGDAGFYPLDAEEPPEVLVNGAVDLGAIATEFLNLGIDPYPRKEGAVFDAPPAGDPASHPFAALAALKKDRDGSKGG